MRETAGDLKKQRNDLQVLHLPKHRRHHLTRHAVTGIDCNGERALEVEKRENLLAVRRPQVHFLSCAVQTRLSHAQA